MRMKLEATGEAEEVPSGAPGIADKDPKGMSEAAKAPPADAEDELLLPDWVIIANFRVSPSTVGRAIEKTDGP